MHVLIHIHRVLIFVFLALFSCCLYADITSGSLELVSSKRVGRTVFEYTYKVQAVNSGGAVNNVSATVTSSSDATKIIDGELEFGNLGANATATSVDTFTLQQNRLTPFTPDVLHFVFQSEAVTAPVVSITSPESLKTVGASPVQVEGDISPDSVTLYVNGAEVSHSGGKFSASVNLEEGLNTIEARAVLGTQTVSDIISLSLDTTPPYVTIESHEDGQTVFENQVTVTGLINDIVRGTIEETQANVTVNGVAAAIVQPQLFCHHSTSGGQQRDHGRRF